MEAYSPGAVGMDFGDQIYGEVSASAGFNNSLTSDFDFTVVSQVLGYG